MQRNMWHLNPFTFSPDWFPVGMRAWKWSRTARVIKFLLLCNKMSNWKKNMLSRLTCWDLLQWKAYSWSPSSDICQDMSGISAKSYTKASFFLSNNEMGRKEEGKEKGKKKERNGRGGEEEGRGGEGIWSRKMADVPISCLPMNTWY